jgi:acyl transferase domain-containing protein/acyl carrier protein
MLDAGIDPNDIGGARHVPVGALMDDIDRFDAPFFGVTSREAELMDPQHRVFLQCAWSALEHAGCDPGRYDGAIGVFAGANFDSYLTRNLIDAGVFEDKASILTAILANDKDYLATRVAYKLNLRGPAYTVQSGCSTSLVAVHLAARSLLGYECDVALAGGVAIDAWRGQGYWAHEGSVFSQDGHVRAFGAGAQGTVFGNGVAVVALKRLEDAIADRDQIYAVMLGSAVNNDGALKVGFTAPSVHGQSEVIAEALADAGVPASTIGYVETHGTGTPLGDPIEIEALTKAFGAWPTGQKCRIGAVKSNVGHLDSAAGVVGLIKTVLALKHGLLPPSLHAVETNPVIAFDRTPFVVNTALVPWTAGPAPGVPRRAGVSSFGMGGTNAHVVLEEAPPAPSEPVTPRAELLVWSARTAEALDRATDDLAALLREHPAAPLADIAYTLQTGRSVFAHRRSLACVSIDDAIAAFDEPGRPRVRTHEHAGGAARVAFVFPGQGAQYPNMGRELYDVDPAFRGEIEACAADLRADAGIDLLALLYPPAGSDPGAAAAALAETGATQPALFAVEYAMARVWQRRGVEPVAFLGHSLGEYVAACLAGVFTRRDALRLVARRGELMQQLPAGAMTAVALAADALELTGSLALAADNGPEMAVVSGSLAEIERFEAELRDRGIEHRRLHTTRAFHSPMTEAIREAFVAAFAGVRLSPPSIPVVSNVTGRWLEAEEAMNPHYWAEQLRRPVRFAPGLRCLAELALSHLLEVGPGRTLATLAAQQRTLGLHVATSLPSAGATGRGDTWALDALGQLWQAGAPVDWSGLPGADRRTRVAVPTYPFERLRFWIDPPPGEDESAAKRAARKLADPGEWLYAPTWTQTLPAALLDRGRVDTDRGHWLVFADGSALSERLVQRLDAAAPGRVTAVTAGASFDATDSRRVVIDPASAGDYGRLIAALRAAGRSPHTIIHLWGVSPQAREGADAAAVVRAQDGGLFSLLHLAQALDPEAPIDLRLVTAGALDVTGREPLSPSLATLHSAARVLPQERAQWMVSCVDIDAEDLSVTGRVEALSAALEAELRCASDPSVAYRGSSRWVPSYVPLSIPAGQTPWRARGTYVILGGLGRIGLSLAGHLAGTAQARLVLVGRTPLPPRAAWATWLDQHDASDLTWRRIQAVLAVERAGGQVEVATADVADAGGLERAFATGERVFGPIDGVIGVAGIIDASTFGLMSTLTPAECARQFRPKIDGLFALDAVLRRRQVPSCLLVSSLSSLLGGLGYGAYSAANGFMDAFARQRNRDGGTRWLAANWDAWRWTEAGSDVPGAALARLAMTPREAAAVFDRLPTAGLAGLPQVVISTSSLSARVSLWVEHVGVRAEQPLPGVAAPAPAPTPVAASPAPAPVETLTATQRAIVEAWSQVLGIRYVELHDSFLDLGGSSLTAVQVISRLERTLGVRIAIEEFIFQTAGQLATLCDQKRAAAATAPSLSATAPPTATGEPADEPLAAPASGGLLRSLRSALGGGRS